MKFLSDYAPDANGLIFVEFEWTEGYREKLFLPPAEAERVVAENEAYNNAHPEEVAEYERQMNEAHEAFMAEQRVEMQASEEADQAQFNADADFFLDELEKRLTKSR